MHIHDFDLAFCVKSNIEEWEGLAPTDVLAALRRRVEELDEGDVLEVVGFLNTILEDDPETGDEVPEVRRAGPGGNPPQPKYPPGTRVVSIFGESGDTDEEVDVHTGPDSVGIVVGVPSELDGSYVLLFANGVCAYAYAEDLADGALYRILGGALLPVGTRIRSIRGETAWVDEEGEVETGPEAVGIVTQVLPEQEHCYAVAFDKGVWVFLSDGELADSQSYRVLEGVSGSDAREGAAP